LGVDLIPFKTCTMNCRFCQLGDSACALSERKEYVPMAEVLAELVRWNECDGQADHITLAGSGEPTLHTGFGEVLRWIKDNTAIASVLLSNGSLFHLPEVRAAAALADKVKVTLSAWDEASFQQIHRPAQGVTFEQLIEGERAFRQEFSGELSLEVFIVEGMNSDVADVRRIAALAESINPDRIDLNTAVRPPADSGVQAVSAGQLTELAGILGSKAEVTASFKKQTSPALAVTPEALLGLIQRHPATAAQLAQDYNAPLDSIFKTLKTLVAEGTLCAEKRDGETYYFHRA
jgi:wyosine [tRNA(Phe)-imidazoG37] synthetase (radical SAM superfamily)